MYGTTSGGGNNNGGTICKLVTATNTLTAEFSFDGEDGAIPDYLKLLLASDGKLYGMTNSGGTTENGIIFSYDPATLTYTHIEDFDGINGSRPYGSLIQASDGKLYGMTWVGGSSDDGVIFSYEPATSTYTKLKDFDNTNGGHPQGNSLAQASNGKLYGMTSGGGSNGYGVIFSYDPPTSVYTKLIDFDNTNGYFPTGDLVQASDGKLYGMTSGGGSNGYGVIFSYDPATSIYTKLIDFDGTNGSGPTGSLMQASDGILYGTTVGGGSNGAGVIFSYDPATLTYTKLKDFDGTNGSRPSGSLIQASDGKLYGMTSYADSSFGAIFSYDPATSNYTKLKGFVYYVDGASPDGSLTQASDGKLYGVTADGGILSYGVIFSYEPATSTYTKLRDFGSNNTGNLMFGGLVKDAANKLYGITSDGGKYGAGTIFSYDANTSVFTKLKDFDYANGGNLYVFGSLIQATDGKLYGMTTAGGSDNDGVIFSYDPATLTYTNLIDFHYKKGAYPYGNLIQASDGKLYGMTAGGGRNGDGVIFSYDPVTSTYRKLIDFDGTNGSGPSGSLVQASDGKLYGMTLYGGSKDYGVVFSYDPATSAYAKLIDFDETNGAYPYGSLIQASDRKLYGMTTSGGSDYGVIFSYDAVTSTYTKLIDFDGSNGGSPYGSLLQASDGKLYGMTAGGGSNEYGVAFSYDPATSVYTKLSDFNGDNGGGPSYTFFTEISAGGAQISIVDKSVIEGKEDRKFISVPVALSESSKKIIRVNYTTQNNTAIAGNDYVAQSGTLVFPPGLKKIILPIRVIGDQTPEANETFSIILSHPVNATIGDSTAIITIMDDDSSALNNSKAIAQTMRAINLSPNPAQDKVKVMLSGYSGNIVLQLSSFDGRMLQQQKLKISSSKPTQQQLNVSSYTNGIYLLTAIDEKGNRQTEKLVIDR